MKDTLEYDQAGKAPHSASIKREKSDILYILRHFRCKVASLSSKSKESVEISLQIILKTVQPSPAIPVGSQDGVNDQPMRRQANGVTNRIPKISEMAAATELGAITLLEVAAALVCERGGVSPNTSVCVHLLSIRTSQLNQPNRIVVLRNIWRSAHGPCFKWR